MFDSIGEDSGRGTGFEESKTHSYEVDLEEAVKEFLYK
jgi:hypothetical protein